MGDLYFLSKFNGGIEYSWVIILVPVRGMSCPNDVAFGQTSLVEVVIRNGRIASVSWLPSLSQHQRSSIGMGIAVCFGYQRSKKRV
jgi:hypothetical protein